MILFVKIKLKITPIVNNIRIYSTFIFFFRHLNSYFIFTIFFYLSIFFKNSTVILTPAPLAPNGLYPHAFSTYAGPAISK